ncbi:MAG: 30S ribosomal protein S6, partial [Rothia sp. (in: high G+C Gram-positive bacteria)]|nr:30S ribosomal protein S6 [Rothia sp. (in: high G+C Gram-positive bacteria)]
MLWKSHSRLAQRRGLIMRAYELMVILNPEVEDKAVEPTLTKFL